MKERNIACCYFPTTVLFVDDSRKFLNSLKLVLDTQKAVYNFFDDPVAVLQFFTEKYHPDPFTKRCLLRPEERHRDYRNIEVDVRAIHREIYNPKRFTDISVLVVDYAMPGLNGLQLCQQLKDKNLKIILLTGEADEKLAIEAFNNGIIHKFIRKDELNFTEVLNEAISELQKEYFYDLSSIVINSLTKNPDYPPCCLDDPIFIQFFEKFCQQHSFMEYYLMDETGSFMFLDAAANPNWLAVKDEDFMKGTVFDAEMSDIDVSPAILEPIKKHEKLLYLQTDADFTKTPPEWLPYLYPANKLQGRATYYYAYINDPKAYDINKQEILSYKAFLAGLSA